MGYGAVFHTFAVFTHPCRFLPTPVSQSVEEYSKIYPVSRLHGLL